MISCFRTKLGKSPYDAEDPEVYNERRETFKEAVEDVENGYFDDGYMDYGLKYPRFQETLASVTYMKPGDKRRSFGTFFVCFFCLFFLTH